MITEILEIILFFLAAIPLMHGDNSEEYLILILGLLYWMAQRKSMQEFASSSSYDNIW